MSKAIFKFSAIAGLVLGSVAALSAQPRVVGKFGSARVAGRDAVVHVWVVVPPGLNENEVALAALRGQGARPFQSDEFTTTGLVWDEFSDGIAGNDFVTQNYNPADEPTGVAGGTALENTHTTWTNVSTSNFAFEYGGLTNRCPSLVKECRGPQKFDGNNDVAWVALGGCCTLGVTWYSTSVDETDMALNMNFPWSTDGVNHYDVETVMLHENGHVLGLGHSNVSGAVMEPYYGPVRRALHADDSYAVSYLYPSATGCTSSEAGFCSDGEDNDCDDATDCGDSDCLNCGNNVAEDCELCDGSDLAGATCESQDFQSGGTLGCNAGCDNGFDISGCTPCADSETSCTDGIDNDCGGGTDCNDNDCNDDAACDAGLLPVGSVCTDGSQCLSGKCKGRSGRKTCK